MVELGIYAIARVYWTVFAAAIAARAPAIREVWVGLGVVTALTGGIMCFTECHLKRLLAFSTISHTGLFLVGVALLTPQGLAGTALYVSGPRRWSRAPSSWGRAFCLTASGVSMRTCSVEPAGGFRGLGLVFLMAAWLFAGCRRLARGWASRCSRIRQGDLVTAG